MAPWPIEIVDDVALVTMQGTPANCQNEQFYATLHETLDTLDREAGDRAVVLTGVATCFSAGLDLSYVGELFVRGDRDELLAWQDRYVGTNLRLFGFDRPLVAAVNGHAFAGGLITALCADERLVARGGARFALNEVEIGIPMPRAYLELIAAAVGWPLATRLSLLTTPLDVDRAAAAGLFDEVCAPEALLRTAIDHAARLGRSLPAFRFTKRAARAPVLARMHEATYGSDRGFVDVVCDAASRDAMRGRVEALRAHGA